MSASNNDDKKPEEIEKVSAEKVSAQDDQQSLERQYGYSVKIANTMHAAESGNLGNGHDTAETEEKKRAPILDNVKAALRPSKIKETAVSGYKSAHGMVNAGAQGCINAIDKFCHFVTSQEGDGRSEVMQQTRKPILFGFWTAFVTFVVGGLWIALAPLDRAVHAFGFVNAESGKQIVQYGEGGRLKEIRVKEGEVVKAGQTLFLIEREDVVGSLKSAQMQYEAIVEQEKGAKQLYAKGFLPKWSLLDIQSKKVSIEAQLEALTHQAKRLNVTSPVDGVVNQIGVTTIGAPVGPSINLCTVTPTEDRLVIDGYVQPNDIELVHVGLEAKVTISAFRHRSVGHLMGKVTFVSHDAIEVPTHKHISQEAQASGGGRSLPYKVRIEVDTEQLKKISKYREYKMRPGMTADISIVTGSRTLLQYLLEPLTVTFMHAFKEN